MVPNLQQRLPLRKDTGSGDPPQNVPRRLPVAPLAGPVQHCPPQLIDRKGFHSGDTFRRDAVSYTAASPPPGSPAPSFGSRKQGGTTTMLKKTGLTLAAGLLAVSAFAANVQSGLKPGADLPAFDVVDISGPS